MSERSAAGRVGRLAVSALATIGLAAGAGMLALPDLPASAATTCTAATWTGLGALGGDHNWSDPANWSGTPPTSTSTSGACSDLTFPSGLTGAALSSNNDVPNVEIGTLSVAAAYTLTGYAVYMGDGTVASAVTATSSATISLAQNLRNTTTYSVSSGDTLTLGGVIAGSGASGTAVVSDGPGTLALYAANLYTGATDVSAGTVQLLNAGGLGASSNTATVAAGAALALGPSSPGLTIPQAITDSGTIVAGDSADHLIAPLTLRSGGRLAAAAGDILYADGAVSGSGPLTVGAPGDTGAVVLDSTTDSNYTGGTTVAEGTLTLDVVPSSGVGLATPGPLTVASGAAATLDAPGQIDPTGTVTLDAGVAAATLDLGGNAATTASLGLGSTSTAAPAVETSTSGGVLTVTGTISSQGTGVPAEISSGLDLAPSSGSVRLDVGNSIILSGPLSGGALILAASGTPNYCASGTSNTGCVAVVASATSTGYSGPVTVTGGVPLDITGTLPAAVDVAGGVLTGTGTAGAVSMSSGDISPGTTVTVPTQPASFRPADDPGVLTASSLSFSGGTLNARLDGTSPGDGSTACSGYDQVAVTGGSVTLGSATTLSAYSDTSLGAPCHIPTNTQTYTIVSNGATGATTTGNFSGEPQGATVNDADSATPFAFTISYTTPPGVALTAASNDTMMLASSLNPSTYGQQVTFTATVSPAPGLTGTPSGTVTFTDSDGGTSVTIVCSQSSTSNNVVTLSSGLASCTPESALPGGADDVVAIYSGDSTFTGNAAKLTQTVDQQTTSTAITTHSPNPSAYGQGVDLTATITPQPASGTKASTVASPTGTVTFYNGSTPLTGCTDAAISTSGGVTTASCTTSSKADLPVGADTVTATYSGDGNYSGSSASGVTQSVNMTSTTTAVSPVTSTSVHGQQVTITATITPAYTGSGEPTGTVTFSTGAGDLADCSGANAPSVSTTSGTTTATCKTTDLPVGKDTVTAAYSGDGNYGGSTGSSTASGYTVDKADSSTALSSSANPVAAGHQVTYTATVAAVPPGAGTPMGTVDFEDNGSAISGCGSKTLSSGSATCSMTYSSPGSHLITAVYSGDGNFNTSTSSGLTQTVSGTIASVTTIVGGGPNPAVGGEVVTFTADVSPASGSLTPTGTVTFDSGGSALADCTAVALSGSGGTASATCRTRALPTGSDSVTAVYSGDSHFSRSTSGAVIETVEASGYWLVARDGGVFSFGPGAHFYGSMGGTHLNAPIVGMAKDPKTGGYWMVASDGGIFSFNAPFYGSMGGTHLNAPIVGMAAAPGGNGYWLVARDGGIFSFGPGAHFYGSMGGTHLNQPVVGMAADPATGGYWMVASDGGIFSFNAPFYGSMGGIQLNQPVVGMAAAPFGTGYWMVASDGGIFSFGPSAIFYGSTGGIRLNQPVVGIASAGPG